MNTYMSTSQAAIWARYTPEQRAARAKKSATARARSQAAKAKLRMGAPEPIKDKAELAAREYARLQELRARDWGSVERTFTTPHSGPPADAVTSALSLAGDAPERDLDALARLIVAVWQKL